MCVLPDCVLINFGIKWRAGRVDLCRGYYSGYCQSSPSINTFGASTQRNKCTKVKKIIDSLF